MFAVSVKATRTREPWPCRSRSQTHRPDRQEAPHGSGFAGFAVHRAADAPRRQLHPGLERELGNRVGPRQGHCRCVRHHRTAPHHPHPELSARLRNSAAKPPGTPSARRLAASPNSVSVPRWSRLSARWSSPACHYSRPASPQNRSMSDRSSGPPSSTTSIPSPPRAQPPAPCSESAREGHRFVYGTGHLGEGDSSRPDGETIYDLASLTKVIALTTMTMFAVQNGKLDAGYSGLALRACLPRTRSERQRHHPNAPDARQRTSGLAAAVSGDAHPSGGAGAGGYDRPHVAARFPLRVLRSWRDGVDPGSRSCARASDRYPATGEIFSQLGMQSTRYLPPSSWVPRIAPTEDDPWRGRMLRGEVHDENASRLEGVSGHAGLFSDADDLLTFAEWLLSQEDQGIVSGEKSALMPGGANERALPASRRARRVHPEAAPGTGLEPGARVGHPFGREQCRQSPFGTRLWPYRLHRYLHLDRPRPVPGYRTFQQSGPSHPGEQPLGASQGTGSRPGCCYPRRKCRFSLSRSELGPHPEDLASLT